MFSPAIYCRERCIKLLSELFPCEGEVPRRGDGVKKHPMFSNMTPLRPLETSMFENKTLLRLLETSMFSNMMPLRLLKASMFSNKTPLRALNASMFENIKKNSPLEALLYQNFIVFLRRCSLKGINRQMNV